MGLSVRRGSAGTAEEPGSHTGSLGWAAAAVLLGAICLE